MIAEQIRKELGSKPEQLFRNFDQTAFAAASLGQVHRAKLKDGREVAVKVQYPGVESTVEQDLKNLKILLNTLGALARDVMRQKVDVDTIYGELEERLKRGTRLLPRSAQHDRVREIFRATIPISSFRRSSRI